MQNDLYLMAHNIVTFIIYFLAIGGASAVLTNLTGETKEFKVLSTKNITTELLPPVVENKVKVSRSAEVYNLTQPQMESKDLCMKDNSTYRLPKNIKPEKYIVTLEIPVKDDVDFVLFNGSITMQFLTEERTDFIVIHCLNLNIDQSSIKITNEDGDLITPAETSSDENTNFYIIKLAKFLKKNFVYNLTIAQFSGNLTYGKTGFDLGTYEEQTSDGKKVKRNFVVTSFEEMRARQAFPCLDEPEFRAKFILKIIRSQGYFSLSNAGIRISGEDLGTGRFMDTFHETPPISTYNVAFFISKFDYITKGRQRFFARPEALKKGLLNDALDIAVKSLEEIEKYLNLNYSVNKIDHVVIPNAYLRFSRQGNWEMIVYREETVFHSKEDALITTSLTDITTTIIHELTHQWIRDLVTIKWWKYNWLKEGLTTYLSLYLGSNFNPDLMFVLLDRKLLGLLYEKYHGYSHDTMTCEVSEDGVGPVYFINYDKSPMVFQMMHHFLTDEIFKEGLNLYLTKFAHKSSEPKDLYDVFQDVLEAKNSTHLLGGHKFHDIMNSWEFTAGTPIVTVNAYFHLGFVKISQAKLTRNGTVPWFKWYIPINFQFGPSNLTEVEPIFGGNENDTKADIWLTEESLTFEVKLPQETWCIINKQGIGYMRVNYDRANWEKLVKVLNSEDFTKIHKQNRVQLIIDSFELAEANVLDFDIPLKLAMYVHREPDLLIISQAFSSLENFYKLNRRNKELLNRYKLKVFKPVMDRVGYDLLYGKLNGKDMYTLILKSLFKFLCSEGDTTCTTKLLELYMKWKKGLVQLPCKLQEDILCSGVKFAKYEDWKYLYQLYLNETDVDARQRLLSSVSCTQNVRAIKEILVNEYFGKYNLTKIEQFIIVDRMEKRKNIARNIFLNYLEEEILPKCENNRNNYFGKGFKSLRCENENDYQKLLRIHKDLSPSNEEDSNFETDEESVRLNAAIGRVLEEMAKNNFSL